MNKLLAIIKREYLERVRSKMFLVATILGPVLMLGFALAPVLISKIKAGGPTRIAIVDQTGRLFDRVRDSLLVPQSAGADDEDEVEAVGTSKKSLGGAVASEEAKYQIENAAVSANRPLEQVKKELNERIRNGRLDAYMVIPPDILTSGQAEFYGRNVGDIITVRQLRDRLGRAVIEQRMIDAQIDQDRVRELSERIKLSSVKVSEQGEERDTGGSFALAFTVGMFIYITILMYGQVILAAVVEEKTTRITEVLFSSVSAFPLMMGKLIGVSLVALTQYIVWAVAFGLIALYGAGALAAFGTDVRLPSITVLSIVYFILFFLIGYFVYATLYLLIGAMVTTTQEGGQVSMPIIFLLVIGFYFVFPVIRSPNSSFAFWVSMVPFFSPITMLVRILTETPPFWQIALSLLIGLVTIVGLVWLAGRVYRTGMLMYGKRASIPEVMRWVRQS